MKFPLAVASWSSIEAGKIAKMGAKILSISRRIVCVCLVL